MILAPVNEDQHQAKKYRCRSTTPAGTHRSIGRKDDGGGVNGVDLNDFEIG